MDGRVSTDPCTMPAAGRAFVRGARAARCGRRSGVRALLPSLLLSLLPALVAANASALSFQVDFRASTHQVQAGDTFADLLAQHQSEVLIATNQLTTLDAISGVTYGGGVSNDFSTLISTDVTILQSGQYTFQLGTDWGRGAGRIAIDLGSGATLDEWATHFDVYWNDDWNDPDVVTSTLNLVAGESYRLSWLGFEGCCGGASTVRFAFESGPFQILDATNAAPYMAAVPEPGTAVLVGTGLTAFAFARRSRPGRGSRP